jgi:hypothetical protein
MVLLSSNYKKARVFSTSFCTSFYMTEPSIIRYARYSSFVHFCQ